MLGSILVLSIALGWLAYGRLLPASRRAFRGAKHKPIASAKDGELVKIQGRVEMGDPAICSPVGGRRCALSESVVSFVMEELPHPKHGDPTVLVRERLPRELHVADESGRAIVELGSARIVLSREDRRRADLTSDPSPLLRRYLAQHGYEAAVFEGRTLRCEERILEHGDPIWIVGRARWERDPHPVGYVRTGYREIARRLVLEPPASGVLVLTDDPDAL